MQQALALQMQQLQQAQAAQLGAANLLQPDPQNSLKQDLSPSVSSQEQEQNYRPGKQVQTAQGMITVPHGVSVAPQRSRKSAQSRKPGDKFSIDEKKYTSRFLVPDQIGEATSFRPVSYLIGKGGCHMKRIAKETEAKLRVRG